MEEDKIIFDDSSKIVRRTTLKEYFAAQQRAHLTASRMWLAVSVSINVGLVILLALEISGR